LESNHSEDGVRPKVNIELDTRNVEYDGGKLIELIQHRVK